MRDDGERPPTINLIHVFVHNSTQPEREKARIIANNELPESPTVVLASAFYTHPSGPCTVQRVLSDLLGIQIMVIASGNADINKLSRFNINAIVNDDNTVNLG